MMTMVPLALSSSTRGSAGGDGGGGGGGGEVNSGGGGGGEEDDGLPARLATKVKPKVLLTIQREVERVTNAAEAGGPTCTTGMKHEDCLAAIVHPRGMRIGKYSGEGDGKMHQRYFRITAGNGCCSVIWAKSSENIEQGGSVSVAGLVGVVDNPEGTLIADRVDFNETNTFAFLITTTVKTLYLCANSAEEREAWVKGINFILHG
jgi:hypothetical protein